MVQGPFKALKDMTSVLVPEELKKDEKGKSTTGGANDSVHTKVRLGILEDTWKVYTIFKKSHGFIQY